MIRRQNRMKTSQIDAAMEMLREQGRYGDTELAHVNPREKAILKAMGGAGSRNPRTGLREYYAGAEPGGSYGEGGRGDYGSPGSPDTAPSPERGDPDSSSPGAGGMDISNNPQVQQESQLESSRNPSFMDRASFAVRSFLDQSLNNPNNIPGLGIGGMIVGQAMSAANRAAREAGYSVQDPISEREAFEAGMPGFGARGDSLAASLGAVPVSAPVPKYLRGGEMAAPQEISSFIGPGMSDLQQRALISTYGTQGVNSAFRTDPVRRYYANLLSRGLISDTGAPVQNPYVLPIEQQYASQVLGRPMTNPSDAAAAYESIRGLL